MVSVGSNPRGYTTAQLAALVARFGPAGTSGIQQIKLGTLVRNTTTGKVMVYNGTDFVNGTDYTA